MSNTSNTHGNTPHIAILASAGMGHLMPSLRLAAMLSSRNCLVTLLTAQPPVSLAEANHISSFISTHPEIRLLDFQLLPPDQIKAAINDPFFFQFEAIRQSVHLLPPLLSSSSPPISAFFCDVSLASSMAQLAAGLCLPFYIVITTSAKFASLMAYLPTLITDPAKFSGSCDEIDIPGTIPLSKSTIPPPFSNPEHFFTKEIVSNAQAFVESKGLLINTFDGFESQTLAALNNGSIVTNLPTVFPIGPLEPYQLEKEESQYLPWLDNQPAESVVYVSFGSRTALSKDQIREVGTGLEESGFRFLWVLKTSTVDKDDKEELKDLLGDQFLERTKSKGIIIKGWVDQEEVLEHPALGGFISHCGWNSVIEAAKRGIPVLAWPQHGDQRVNAEVVVDSGLGKCERNWGWVGQKLVKGEEIAEMVREVMEDDKLKGKAKSIGEEARKAFGNGGSSEIALTKIIEMLKQ